MPLTALQDQSVSSLWLNQLDQHILIPKQSNRLITSDSLNNIYHHSKHCGRRSVTATGEPDLHSRS